VTHYGQTVYQGARGTAAVRLSPSLGPKEAARHQYYREDSYVPALLPTAEKLGNKLFTASSQRMRSLDPAVDSLLKIWLDDSPLTRKHYCRAKIVGHGVPTSRKRTSGKLKDSFWGHVWVGLQHTMLIPTMYSSQNTKK
jgi:hypothetical protein